MLPYDRVENAHAFPAREVTKVALRLKHQVEQIIPYEIEQTRITNARSSIVTSNVIATSKSAGEGIFSNSDDNHNDLSDCVVYCLLLCRQWFSRQAILEPFDADLHDARALACEVIAKRIIESEKDMTYLMEDVLLKRYSTIVGGEETHPTNVIERAIDLHALRVIGSSGYQKCISDLWRGWLVQDEQDPSRFVEYKLKASTRYWDHFDPGS